jgi:hypothetical protein
MTVNLDDHRIDHGISRVRLLRSGIEQPLEDISFHPIQHEYRIPLAETGR